MISTNSCDGFTIWKIIEYTYGFLSPTNLIPAFERLSHACQTTFHERKLLKNSFNSQTQPHPELRPRLPGLPPRRPRAVRPRRSHCQALRWAPEGVRRRIRRPRWLRRWPRRLWWRPRRLWRWTWRLRRRPWRLWRRPRRLRRRPWVRQEVRRCWARLRRLWRLWRLWRLRRLRPWVRRLRRRLRPRRLRRLRRPLLRLISEAAIGEKKVPYSEILTLMHAEKRRNKRDGEISVKNTCCSIP